MKIVIPCARWDSLGCDDPEAHDFVRRCLYLGYGYHAIQGWVTDLTSSVGRARFQDVYDVSEMMGISDEDRIFKGV